MSDLLKQMISSYEFLLHKLGKDHPETKAVKNALIVLRGAEGV